MDVNDQQAEAVFKIISEFVEDQGSWNHCLRKLRLHQFPSDIERERNTEERDT